MGVFGCSISTRVSDQKPLVLHQGRLMEPEVPGGRADVLPAHSGVSVGLCLPGGVHSGQLLQN